MASQERPQFSIPVDGKGEEGFVRCSQVGYETPSCAMLMIATIISNKTWRVLLM